MKKAAGARMTCIVGVVDDEGNALLGADSAGSADEELTVRQDAKVFRRGKFLIGCCGSFRVAQILQYVLRLPKRATAQRAACSDMQYIVRDVVGAIRACLREQGALQEEEHVQAMDACVLLAYRGRVYEVHGDFQVGVAADGFSAVGSGAAVARGALYAARQLGTLSAEQAALMALEASERFCGSVRRPFHVLHLPRHSAHVQSAEIV